MANRLRQPQSVTDKNAAILRDLMKRPENRVCADCHVNTHPRWTSWSLGVFICIRCSGIHRGLGTHVSRVKSADLDAWTDEQTQMMVKWGNRRANKYWEANLAPGHVPSDSKMENFIRTKYSSKRWALSATPPTDPSTLDDIPSHSDEDQDVPLAIVQKTLQRDRDTSLSTRSLSLATTKGVVTGDETKLARESNLLDPPNKSRTPSPSLAVRARTDRVSNSSLLGLEFDSPVQTHTAPVIAADSGRPTSRNDLKNSILKLYAPPAKPAPAPSAPPLTIGPTAPSGKTAPSSNLTALGDLSSAFGGLDITPATKPAPVTSNPPLSSSSLSSLISSKLSFGATKPVAPQPTKPVGVPSSFTIPMKNPSNISIPATPSPGLTPLSAASPAITPVSASPAPQTANLTSANYAANFNLSKPTTTTTSTSTAPTTITPKPIQLLSSLMPTSTAPPPGTQTTTTAPAPSSFGNPWASTANARSSGATAGYNGNPWASTAGTTTSVPQASKTSTSSTVGGPSNSRESGFGMTTTSGFGASDTNTAFNKGSSISGIGSGFGDWATTTTTTAAPAAATKSNGSASAENHGFGDWTSTTTVKAGSAANDGFGDWATSTTTAKTKEREKKDSSFSDDFGLFATADVWK